MEGSSRGASPARLHPESKAWPPSGPLPYSCPSKVGPGAALAGEGLHRGPGPRRQAFPVPGAGQAGKPQHLTGVFPGTRRESGVLQGLCEGTRSQSWAETP